MDYTFKFNQTPYNSVIDMIRWSRERQDARNKERNDNYAKLMQMLGRGVAAYKMNKDMNDWKADQAYWNDESDMLDLIGTGYYDPNDIDIDAVLEQERLMSNPSDWRNQYGNSHRFGADDLPTLQDLGLA
jgi:hypothetical protein